MSETTSIAGGVGIAAALAAVGLLGAPWYEATFASGTPGSPLAVTEVTAWEVLDGEDIAIAILTGAAALCLFAAVVASSPGYSLAGGVLAVPAAGLVLYRILDTPGSDVANREVDVLVAGWLTLAAVAVLLFVCLYVSRTIPGRGESP
ncbi:MAG: hypothetical protein ACRDK9_07070 [Solirubrobacterales bacterium]